MAKRMKRLQFDQIIELLKKVDTESIYEKVTKVPHSDDLYQEMEKYLNSTDWEIIAEEEPLLILRNVK